MIIETDRLIITEFTPDMAEAVYRNSLDEDVYRFVPDEVFETVEDAEKTIGFLTGRYNGDKGPFAYPVLTKTGDNIGYVQLVPIDAGWEIGFHIAKPYTCNGYATEAVSAFLPWITDKTRTDIVFGVCLADNSASIHVMDKCGFIPEYEGTGEYQGEQRDIVRKVWRRSCSDVKY